MSYILTFVSAQNTLSEDTIASLATIQSKVTWLAANKAAEIIIPKRLKQPEMLALQEKAKTHQIDIFCTSSANRKKSLFMADMDSTIVTSETLDELAAEAGIKDKISAITDRAMRGELDFHDALRERVMLIKDLSTEALKRTLDNTEISNGAQTLLNTLKNNNVFTALVSGGFTYYTGAIAAQLGFDVHHGNQLDISDNKLTGKVIDPILDKDSKLAYLNQYVQSKNIFIGDTIAIGDGANDLPMLKSAGLGIGYHPKPLVKAEILNSIIHTNLTSVLFMQGYKSDEFID